MAPAVIADSDDSDGSSYSPPPKTPAAVLEATRSHDTADRSASTDSAFFRSVLEEQSLAAQTCANALTPEPGIESGSFDAEGLMSTDPLQGQEEDAQSVEKGRKVDDPWEIPSSPDVRQRSAAKKKKKEPMKTPKTKQKQFPANASTGPSNDEGMRRSSKRRKTSPSTQDSDSIDLIQLPPTEEADITPSTMPPPAHPSQKSQKTPRAIGSHLTDSQKREYESFAATGTTELSQDQGLMRGEDAGPIMRSSSSGTNCNTPRSEARVSRNMDSILEEVDEEKTPVKEVIGVGVACWGSSPDEIAGVEPVDATTPVPRGKRRKGRKSLQSDKEDDDEPNTKKKPKGRKTLHSDNEDDEPDTNYEEKDQRGHYDDNDEESDFMEKPAVQKGKKGRGRPKKTPAAGPAAEPALKSAEDSTIPTTSHAAEGRSVTKTKRKRGRPKKAEQQAVEVVKDEQYADKQEEVARQDQEETIADAEPLGQTGQAILAKDTEPTASDRKIPDDKDETDQAPKGKPSALVSKGLVSAGSWSATKPLYRVGLSKKLRIAPLLKIRKP